MNHRRRRAPIKRRLREIAASALVDLVLVDEDPTFEPPVAERTETIPVAYTWAGENITTSTFYLGRTTGRTEPGSLGQKPVTQDRFSIACHIAIPVFDMAHGEQAEEAAERALNAFAEALASCKQLVNPGIESAMDPEDYQVSSCFIADGDLFHGLSKPDSASISGGVTFTIEVLYALKPTPSTGS